MSMPQNLSALMFTRHGDMIRRFSDVNDNAVYWDFVVVSWLPIYALIYWFPRVVRRWRHLNKHP